MLHLARILSGDSGAGYQSLGSVRPTSDVTEVDLRRAKASLAAPAGCMPAMIGDGTHLKLLQYALCSLISNKSRATTARIVRENDATHRLSGKSVE